MKSPVRFLPLAVALLVAMLSLVVLTVLDKREQAMLEQEQRLQVAQQLSAVRARLEGTLNAAVASARGMAAAYLAHPGFSKAEFDVLAESLMRHNPAIRNFALVKGTVIVDAYPEAANRSVIGVDYRKLPDQWPAYKHMMETGQATVAGPVKLIQGEVSIIVRIPIMQPATRNYIGAIAMPIHLERLFNTSGVSELQEMMHLGLRIRHADGQRGDAFLGDANVFRHDALIDQIELPGGAVTWEIAARPRQGWRGADPAALEILRGVGLVACLLLAALSYGLMRYMLLRRENEIRLRESEAHLAQRNHALGATSQGLMITDSDRRITYANDACLKLTGYSMEELLGNSASLLHGAGTDPETVERIEQALNAMQPFSGEVLNYRKDGTAFWNDLSITPIFDSKQRTLQYVGVQRDVTKRKRDEQMLRFMNESLLRQNQVLAQIAEGRPLSKVLETLVQFTEQMLPDALCSVLLLDPDGIHLRHGAAPSLPDAYNHALEALPVSDGAGSCGTAAATGQRIIVEDIRHHPYWQPYLHLADLAGVASCWSEPILGQFGQVLGTFAIYHREPRYPDENELRLIGETTLLAALAIQQVRLIEETHIAAIAFDVQEGIVVTDANQTILRVNQAFTRLTGYQPEEVVGSSLEIFNSGRQDEQFYQEMRETLARDHYWQGEIWNRRKSGEDYPEWLTVTVVTDENGRITHYIAAFSDISELKNSEKAIHELAFYDPLTQLPNRRLLMDRLQQGVSSVGRKATHSALLFIDLDDFKMLNDTKGHDLGDRLLVEVAQRLKAGVRECDTVARFGGDEFIVILEDLNEHAELAAGQAEAVARKLLQALAEPFALGDGILFQNTASIGISIFHGLDIQADELLKRADMAMYQAKQSGRNTLRFFDPAMQRAIEERMNMDADLKQALAQQQFRLYYQPQVYHTGVVLGAEVLLRWAHPQRGMVSPLEFIPLAEESGMILAIGRWVLESACRQLKLWESSVDTRYLRLSANVSARQFRQPDFVAQVRQVLEQTEANPDMLMLEMTESLLLEDVGDAIAKMHELRGLGVRFSLDDFGTGYSSLSYLTRLPLDELKIDRAFVQNVGNTASDDAIVQTIVAMANTLGMEVIAEGVETTEQRDYLLAIGCPLFQGYYYGKPMPLADFEAELLASVT